MTGGGPPHARSAVSKRVIGVSEGDAGILPYAQCGERPNGTAVVQSGISFSPAR